MEIVQVSSRSGGSSQGNRSIFRCEAAVDFLALSVDAFVRSICMLYIFDYPCIVHWSY